MPVSITSSGVHEPFLLVRDEAEEGERQRERELPARRIRPSREASALPQLASRCARATKGKHSDRGRRKAEWLSRRPSGGSIPAPRFRTACRPRRATLYRRMFSMLTWCGRTSGVDRSGASRWARAPKVQVQLNTLNPFKTLDAEEDRADTRERPSDGHRRHARGARHRVFTRERRRCRAGDAMHMANDEGRNPVPEYPTWRQRCTRILDAFMSILATSAHSHASACAETTPSAIRTAWKA